MYFATLWAIQSMDFSRPEYWSGSLFPSPGDLPNPGIKPRSPALWDGSLPAEPQGQPKNTAVGSLSLLRRIFPIQESNWGLLHCRQILYQLSYQGRTLEYILSSHYLPCEEPCQKLKETAHFNSRREFFLPSPRNKPSMRSQIVGHNLAPNEQQQKDKQDQWTQVL